MAALPLDRDIGVRTEANPRCKNQSRHLANAAFYRLNGR